MNIRNSFTILSYVFRMLANKLSYEKFTKELRKNYEKYTIDWRVTKSLRKVYETICNALVTLLMSLTGLFGEIILRFAINVGVCEIVKIAN